MDLMHATENNDTSEVFSFLMKGVDPDTTRDQNGWTALHEAAGLNHVSVAKLLIAAGANPNFATLGDRTPLHDASKCGHEEMVTVLLTAGANPNFVTSGGWTPLHFAVRYGKVNIVQILLGARANPDTADQYDSTPLHSAAHYGPAAIVQLLLAAGANPTLKNEEDETPSQVAGTPELRAVLADAEYVWKHTWSPEEHHRWTEAHRLERVGALSAFRSGVRHLSVPVGTDTGRRIVIPELPRELQFAVFEHL